MVILVGKARYFETHCLIHHQMLSVSKALQRPSLGVVAAHKNSSDSLRARVYLE